jgi:hypothetical protein
MFHNSLWNAAQGWQLWTGDAIDYWQGQAPTISPVLNTWQDMVQQEQRRRNVSTLLGIVVVVVLLRRLSK